MMKNQLIFLLASFLLFNFSAASLIAQTDNSQLYAIRTTKVKPYNQTAYENAIKKANAAFKEAKVNLEYYVNSTHTYEYFTAVPIENLAELDKSYWAEAISKLGLEKLMELAKPVEEFTSETNVDIYAHLKDFDYKHPSLKDTKMNFRKWYIYEFKPSATLLIKPLMKEWIDVYKKYDVIRDQSYYISRIGPNDGTVVLTMDAKDEETHAQQDKAFFEKVGEEGRALWEKTEALLVSHETRTGSFRPDLSMFPMIAATADSAEKE